MTLIVGFAVGKRTIRSCNNFMMCVIGDVELPTQSNPIEFYGTWVLPISRRLKKVHDSTRLSLWSIVKNKECWQIDENNLSVGCWVKYILAISGHRR